MRPLLQISTKYLVRQQHLVRTMATAPSSASEMLFTFASPNGVIYNQVKNVKQVDVPTLSGCFGILVNHVPTLAVLKPGVVTVTEAEGGAVKKFFVSSGSVSVNPDSSVQILAEEAFPLDKLDLSSAQAQVQQAQQAISSASNDRAKAEAQIALECAEAIVKAIQTGA